jgi:hypothetical protein
MNRGRPPLWKSPWLWIGLSCGVLALVLAVFVLFSLVPLIGYYRPGGYRDRVRNEPTLLFAEMAARNDPNVKVVARDTNLHTVTLRNQKTGERFVLGQTGKDDKLSIRTDAGEVVLDISRPQPNWALGLGSGARPIPSWVPASPETKPRALYSLDTGEVVSGCSILTPSGPVEDVLAFYRAELERKGFELVPGDSLSASSPDYSSSVFLGPTEQGGQPALLLTWSQMTGPR